MVGKNYAAGNADGGWYAGCYIVKTGIRKRRKEILMPYSKVSELPKAQVDQYSAHQKKAFLEAFNSAYKEYGHDESRAFAVAHTAAKRASESKAKK